MAITYTTLIKSIEKKDIDELKSVVVKIYWTLTGINENSVSAEYNAWTEVSHDGTETFTPFEELNHARVLSWIPEYDIENAKPIIEQRIALAANPAVTVTFSELPWNKPSEEVVSVMGPDLTGIGPKG